MFVLALLGSSLATAAPTWELIEVELTNESIEKLTEAELLQEASDPYKINLDLALLDKTAPAVRLWAVVEGPRGIVDDVLVTTTDESMTMTRNDVVALIASANEDPTSSVASVEILGETSQTCLDPMRKIGRRTTAFWSATNADKDLTDGRDSTYRAIGFNVQHASFPCPRGWSLTSSSMVFWATAVNRAGLRSTTADVTVKL
ncbi:MAG: hypothetical protein AB8H79_01165 [Myxococcota bacterium]